MKDRLLFERIPDTVIVADSYGYVMDFNHEPVPGLLKKGQGLKHLLPGFPEESESTLEHSSHLYRCVTTGIRQDGRLLGYTVLLSDITEETCLSEETAKVRSSLDEHIEALRAQNEALQSSVLQIRALSDYTEQLRLARRIHDDSGHAVTALHMISELCLGLKDSDPARCRELLKEGLRICESAGRTADSQDFDSLAALLHAFKTGSPFPVEYSVAGKEPAFLKKYYPVIARVMKEACHNTLSHTLADRFLISVSLSPEKAVFTFTDNGEFRGEFEKGFGLTAVEDQVTGSGGKVSFSAEEGKAFVITAEWEEK